MWAESLSVVQLAIGLLFLQSSVGKLIAPTAFANGLRQYGLLPSALVAPTAAALIATEALIALSHLTGWMLSSVMAIAIGLLLIFLAVAVFTLRKRKPVPCLCFGAGDTQPLSWQSIVRLVLLAAAEVLLLLGAAAGVDGSMPYEMDGFTLSVTLASAILLVIVSTWSLSMTELLALARQCSSCNSRTQAQQ